MRDWIVIGVLYILVLTLFRLLGGLSSAAEALRSWGAASAALRRNPGSS
jgi:hypothetical protein